jgi:hypothetical protein
MTNMHILWRVCNLTAFTHSSTGPVVYPFASRHEGTRVQSPGGYLCENGILLLALSRYNTVRYLLYVQPVLRICICVDPHDFGLLDLQLDPNADSSCGSGLSYVKICAEILITNMIINITVRDIK